MTENLPAIIPVKDVQVMAMAIAKSGLFGLKTSDQALALMLIAQAEGLHPAIAARDYHIIQGRPALKADAMLSRYLESGGKVQWHDYTDSKVSATFSHPAGGTIKIDWDMPRAKRAGLGEKDIWKKYPRQMLRARVLSEGIRATNPGCNQGFYTPEEVQDFEPINVTPIAEQTDPEPQPPPEEKPEPQAPPPPSDEKAFMKSQATKITHFAKHELGLTEEESLNVINWYLANNDHGGRTWKAGQALVNGFMTIYTRYRQNVQMQEGA